MRTVVRDCLLVSFLLVCVQSALTHIWIIAAEVAQFIAYITVHVGTLGRYARGRDWAC